WWNDARGSEFFAIDGKTVRRSLRPDTIREEIEGSLQRLGTDYVDLYQTHWPSVEPDRTAIGDTMACLLKLHDEGKIRAIGVCNVSTGELAEHLACGSVASDQFRYSMLWRGPEKDILPMCRERGLAALTYMSLEQGLLTGKVGMDRTFGQVEFRSNTDWNPWYKPENRRRVLDMLERWKELAVRYTCEMAVLVAAWTLAQPGVTHVLCGARRPDQIIQTAAAADLVIAPEDLQRMRQDVEVLGEPA
ncbi:MAG: aldo/keto reductase, partial [Planctomycetes bacterium]|nr:aldo/keto reductase [Planctomycetota bacterium]